MRKKAALRTPEIIQEGKKISKHKPVREISEAFVLNDGPLSKATTKDR